MVMIKFCRKCDTDTERRSNGECRPCISLRNAKYRKENATKIKEYKAAYYESNKAEINAKSSAYRKANTQKVAFAIAAWRASNPERLRELSAAWARANPHKVRATNAAYRAANKDKAREYRRKWDSENRDKIRIKWQNRHERKRQGAGRLSTGLAQRLLMLQQGKCACCHVSLGAGYHLDHIMPLALGGVHEDSNIQLLCRACNLSKHAKHPVEFMQQKGFLL